MGKNIEKRLEDLEKKVGGEDPPRVVFCWDDKPCEYGEDDTVIIFSWGNPRGA